MAFKMKNPSLMKMAKAAGDNRVAMKMKAESAAKMKKSPMKDDEGKPSDESKDNVKAAKDLVKQAKEARRASRKADTAANKQARKDNRAEKASANEREKVAKIAEKASDKKARIDEKAEKRTKRVTGELKQERKTARRQAQTKRVVDRTKRKDDKLTMKQQDIRDRGAKKIERLEGKKSAMKLDDKKDTRTAEKKTADFNKAHSERLGTTATYNPESSKKAGKNVYTADKSNKQMAAEHRARFERNVRKTSPNMSAKEMDEAYKNRKKK